MKSRDEESTSSSTESEIKLNERKKLINLFLKSVSELNDKMERALGQEIRNAKLSHGHGGFRLHSFTIMITMGVYLQRPWIHSS